LNDSYEKFSKDEENTKFDQNFKDIDTNNNLKSDNQEQIEETKVEVAIQSSQNKGMEVSKTDGTPIDLELPRDSSIFESIDPSTNPLLRNLRIFNIKESIKIISSKLSSEHPFKVNTLELINSTSPSFDEKVPIKDYIEPICTLVRATQSKIALNGFDIAADNFEDIMSSASKTTKLIFNKCSIEFKDKMEKECEGQSTLQYLGIVNCCKQDGNFEKSDFGTLLQFIKHSPFVDTLNTINTHHCDIASQDIALLLKIHQLNKISVKYSKYRPPKQKNE
jgi:hypothetical protein